MHFKYPAFVLSPSITSLDIIVCVDDFLPLLLFAFTGELSHFTIFLFLVVAFSFPPTGVLLAFACL